LYADTRCPDPLLQKGAVAPEVTPPSRPRFGGQPGKDLLVHLTGKGECLFGLRADGFLRSAGIAKNPGVAGQACVSARRCGSCDIQECPLADDRRRERGFQVQPTVKGLPSPDQDVGGGSEPPEEAVCFLG